MKLELPFAIGLLALGAASWAMQSQPGNPPLTTATSGGQSRGFIAIAGSPDVHAKPEFSQSNSRTSNSTNLVAASFQEEVPADSNRQTKELGPAKKLSDQEIIASLASKNAQSPLVRNSVGVAADFLANNEASSGQSRAILNATAQRIADSKPFGTPISLTGNVMGQFVEANGQYFQMGQGSAKTRMELRFGGKGFGANKTSPTLIQLCDGRFVYSIQSRGSKHDFEFLDSDRIKRKSVQAAQDVVSPTGLISKGGISGVLKQLSNSFQFNAPLTLPNGSQVIRGSWRPERLQELLAGSPSYPSSKNGESPLHWNTLPKQLPHAVEIALATNPETGDMPSQISFFQFHATEGRLNVNPFVSISFGMPQVIEDLDEKYFVLDSKNLESVDTTDRYLARLKSINDTMNQSVATNRDETQKSLSVER